jgi:hypothetical protein
MGVDKSISNPRQLMDCLMSKWVSFTAKNGANFSDKDNDEYLRTVQ